MRDAGLGIPLLSSVALHLCAIVLASVFLHAKSPRQQNYFAVRLVEAPKSAEAPPRMIAADKNIPLRPEVSKETKAPAKNAVSGLPKSLLPLPETQSKPAKPTETKAAAPAQTESAPGPISNQHGEDGGSPPGPVASFGEGDVGNIPGSEAGLGGRGLAAFGLGRGPGAPGLPGQTLLRANREAKPVQNARANYPPMALRAGLESDVTLKIEVDPQGNVIKAEVTKSGGELFDEEALKAVKQSRFEPAQRDGENIAAEFTYVYRFRLRR